MSIASGERLFASTVSGISLFTQQGGARLFAGKDKVEIQEQDGALQAIARLGIQIISTEQGIEIIAKEGIKLNAGGSQIEIADGVKINTGGKFEAKASEHKFIAGGSILLNLPFLPNLRSKLFHRKVQFINEITNEPLAEMPYKFIDRQTNQIFEGVTDVKDETKLIKTVNQDTLKLVEEQQNIEQAIQEMDSLLKQK